MNLIDFFIRHQREILQATLEHIWLVGIVDAAGRSHRRSARNYRHAPSLAFETDSRRSEHRRNDSKSRALWISASGAVARRSRWTGS